MPARARLNPVNRIPESELQRVHHTLFERWRQRAPRRAGHAYPKATVDKPAGRPSSGGQALLRRASASVDQSMVTMEERMLQSSGFSVGAGFAGLAPGGGGGAAAAWVR